MKPLKGSRESNGNRNTLTYATIKGILSDQEKGENKNHCLMLTIREKKFSILIPSARTRNRHLWWIKNRLRIILQYISQKKISGIQKNITYTNLRSTTLIQFLLNVHSQHLTTERQAFGLFNHLLVRWDCIVAHDYVALKHSKDTAINNHSEC